GSPYKFGEPIAGFQTMFDGFWRSVDVGIESAKTGARTSQIEGGSLAPNPYAGTRAISSQALGLEDTGIGKGIDYLGSVLGFAPRAIGGVHQFTHDMGRQFAGGMIAFREAVNSANAEGLTGIASYQKAFSTYADTVNDMPAKMRLNASKEADQMTFVNQLEKGSLPGLAQQAAELPILRTLLPFFKIAYNVKKWGADMTPGVGAILQLPN